jgi:hypothetical protein
MRCAGRSCVCPGSRECVVPETIDELARLARDCAQSATPTASCWPRRRMEIPEWQASSFRNGKRGAARNRLHRLPPPGTPAQRLTESGRVRNTNAGTFIRAFRITQSSCAQRRETRAPRIRRSASPCRMAGGVFTRAGRVDGTCNCERQHRHVPAAVLLPAARGTESNANHTIAGSSTWTSRRSGASKRWPPAAVLGKSRSPRSIRVRSAARATPRRRLLKS